MVELVGFVIGQVCDWSAFRMAVKILREIWSTDLLKLIVE